MTKTNTYAVDGGELVCVDKPEYAECSNVALRRCAIAVLASEGDGDARQTLFLAHCVGGGNVPVVATNGDPYMVHIDNEDSPWTFEEIQSLALDAGFDEAKEWDVPVYPSDRDPATHEYRVPCVWIVTIDGSSDVLFFTSFEAAKFYIEADGWVHPRTHLAFWSKDGKTARIDCEPIYGMGQAVRFAESSK